MLQTGVLERPALYRAVTASSSASAICSWMNSSAKPSSRFRTTRACTLPSMTSDFGGDRRARSRQVDDAARHLAAVLKREHRNRVAGHDTVVAAVFRQVEDIAVGEPGELGGKLVALAGGGADRHSKAVVDDPRDLALDPADMVEIGDYAVADIADAGRQQGKAPRRHIDDLAGKFAPVGQHVAAEQMHLHPLEAPTLLGGWKTGFSLHQ